MIMIYEKITYEQVYTTYDIISKSNTTQKIKRVRIKAIIIRKEIRVPHEEKYCCDIERIMNSNPLTRTTIILLS